MTKPKQRRRAKAPGLPTPAQVNAMQWPAAEVEMVATADLVPNARNARTHSPEQVRTIADLMLISGVTTAILRDEEGGIIAGHGRVLGAEFNQSRGYTRFARIPAMTARGWSDEQKRAYILADNQVALKAGWNNDLLRGELIDLGAAGLDLGTLGFDDLDLRQLEIPGYTLEQVTEEAEKTPPPPAKPIVRLGELWLLGEQRLLIGDCTDPANVERLLGSDKPQLMATDPPYGVDYNPDWRNELPVAAAANMNRTAQSKAVGKVVNDTRDDWRAAWRLFKGDVAYVWQGDKQIASMASQLEDAGFVIRNLIVWRKNSAPVGRGDYHVAHETCWYAVRKGKTGHWHGGRKQNTDWDIDRPHKTETMHGTQKPLECMRRPILNNTAKGDAVYDPFLGSGTTLIAAQMEGRRCYGMEIDPVYAQVIIERWEAFTKHAATLDGVPFAQVRAEREKKTTKGRKSK